MQDVRGTLGRSVLAACAAMMLCAPAPIQREGVIVAQPGDVVRIDGEASLWGMTWHDLIGIDLATKPGTYRLSTGSSLNVVPKQFRVRRLTVPANFVNPPPEALTQIAEDYKKTEALWHVLTRRKWNGPFVLPVSGTPTSNFGTRSIFNRQPRSPHAGVDFLSAAGTPVRAGNTGLVVLAQPLYFTGNTIIIDFGDGLYSMFAHLSEFRAQEGDNVTPSTVVGLVGATGRVTGPHLHWAVRLQGAQVDPLALIAATAGDAPHSVPR
jgi:murein DD-endopeptidase MepM/ murein hydrolase activator NlpD